MMGNMSPSSGKGDCRGGPFLIFLLHASRYRLARGRELVDGVCGRRRIKKLRCYDLLLRSSTRIPAGRGKEQREQEAAWPNVEALVWEDPVFLAVGGSKV